MIKREINIFLDDIYLLNKKLGGQKYKGIVKRRQSWKKRYFIFPRLQKFPNKIL